MPTLAPSFNNTPDQTVVKIPLTQGYVALVDVEDAAELLKHKWSLHRVRSRGCTKLYAVRTKPRGTGTGVILMHRAILQPGPRQHVDHIDGNGLNNTRRNIRVCTQQQNNAHAFHRVGKSGYRGVRWVKSKRTWYAYISFNNKRLFCGGSVDPKVAAMKYDRKARELFGEFAVLNFPNESLAVDAAA